jgi:hypothetical protein
MERTKTMDVKNDPAGRVEVSGVEVRNNGSLMPRCIDREPPA